MREGERSAWAHLFVGALEAGDLSRRTGCVGLKLLLLKAARRRVGGEKMKLNITAAKGRSSPAPSPTHLIFSLSCWISSSLASSC